MFDLLNFIQTVAPSFVFTAGIFTFYHSCHYSKWNISTVVLCFLLSIILGTLNPIKTGFEILILMIFYYIAVFYIIARLVFKVNCDCDSENINNSKDNR